MTRPPPLTKTGKDFYAVASLLQKSLRRGDVVYASRAVTELLPKFGSYVWNRLMIVSAEDCGDLVTAEIVGLYDAWWKVTGGKFNPQRPNYGLVFFMKAVVILAKARR
jgi:replication-associated recombination protein RarA